MSQLVVLGSVNADHVIQVPSFPRPGETLHGRNYQIIAGGKGANQALAAQRLGAGVSFIACVGDDSFGINLRQQYQQDGMNVEAVEVLTDTPTGVAMIQVSDCGENSICIVAGANEGVTAEMISKYQTKIEQAQILLMQLETPIAGIIAAAEIAKAKQTKVVLNPAPARPLPAELLSLVDVITPNETEAQLLTGIEVVDEASAAQAAAVFHQQGIGLVLITLGAKGVWVSEHKRDQDAQASGQIIAGFKVQATDTTAAGDTFNGGLVTALLEGKPLTEAIRFAHAAAAISVTRFGAQTSIPSRAEVDQFLMQQAEEKA